MAQQAVSTYFFTRLIDFISPLCIIDDEAKLSLFKKAVDQYTYYTFTIDALIDGEIKFDNSPNLSDHKLVKAYLSNRMALQSLASIFSADSSFWSVMDHYMSTYYMGLVLEKQNSATKWMHTIESFKSYALSKHAPAFVPSSGLLLLFNASTDQVTLENLLTPLFYGMQMLDDMEDFNKDIESNQLTYCISRVYQYIEEQNMEVRSDLKRFEERVFYLSGIAKSCNDFATSQFKDAQDQAKALKLNELVLWIDSMFKMLQHNRTIIDQVSK